MNQINGRIPPITPQLVQAVARRVYQLWLRDVEQAKERQRWSQSQRPQKGNQP